MVAEIPVPEIFLDIEARKLATALKENAILAEVTTAEDMVSDQFYEYCMVLSDVDQAVLRWMYNHVDSYDLSDGLKNLVAFELLCRDVFSEDVE